MRLAPALRVKFADTERGVITGYGSTFGGTPDSYGDVIAPGAFARSLAEHKAAGTMPLLLWQHRAAEPIGRIAELKEDDHGLYLEGRLNLETTRGRDAHAHLVAKDVDSFSIGFFIADGGQTRNADGTSLLTDLDLAEVSVVSFPANRNARIQHAKSLESKSELVDLLREGGLSRTAAQRVAAGGWPALAGEDNRQALELARRVLQAVDDIRSM